jgi:hypothetical protein
VRNKWGTLGQRWYNGLLKSCVTPPWFQPLPHSNGQGLVLPSERLSHLAECPKIREVFVRLSGTFLPKARKAFNSTRASVIYLGIYSTATRFYRARCLPCT